MPERKHRSQNKKRCLRGFRFSQELVANNHALAGNVATGGSAVMAARAAEEARAPAEVREATAAPPRAAGSLSAAASSHSATRPSPATKSPIPRDPLSPAAGSTNPVQAQCKPPARSSAATPQPKAPTTLSVPPPRAWPPRPRARSRSAPRARAAAQAAAQALLCRRSSPQANTSTGTNRLIISPCTISPHTIPSRIKSFTTSSPRCRIMDRARNLVMLTSLDQSNPAMRPRRPAERWHGSVRSAPWFRSSILGPSAGSA